MGLSWNRGRHPRVTALVRLRGWRRIWRNPTAPLLITAAPPFCLTQVGLQALKNKKLVCSLGPVCETEQRLMVGALIRVMTIPVLMATPRRSRQLHCQVKSTGAKIHVQDYSWKADCAMRPFISGRPLHFMSMIIWSEWTLIWYDRFQCTYALPVADTQ